ncbi:MAG: 5'-methylthioadenosine/S-adenosylhomocysteine nucleosidase [Geminicoccaceae bacterium]
MHRPRLRAWPALTPDPAVGDIVIGERTLQHDAGVLQGELWVHTHQAGHVPFSTRPIWLGYTAPALALRRIRERLDGFALPPLSPAAGGTGRPPRVTFGTILTGDQFLNCEATRRRLFEELGGHAIEMEGGAVGQVAEAFGLPHLVIRALSDLAGAESHFDFGRFVEETAAGSAAILRHLLPAL